jgi:hypothetical protein
VLTGYLPVEQGIACYAALRHHGDAAVAAGDARTRDQIMADTLVERVTGQATAADVNVELQLMMPLDALINTDDHKAAMIPGYGPLPWLCLGDRGQQSGTEMVASPFHRPHRRRRLLRPDCEWGPDPAVLRRLACQTDSAPRPNLSGSVL